MLNTISAFAWGPMGHDVVAAIAEQNLSRKAKKAIDQILDGKSIVYYASWMDSIQNSHEWKGGYDKTKTWHYCNVDKGYTYDTMPKCPTGDVVTALNQLTKELTENFDKLSDKEKADYLKMVIHMVGDMHCPVHTKYSPEEPNLKQRSVKMNGKKLGFHSYWDASVGYYNQGMKCDHIAAKYDTLTDEQIAAICEGTPNDWATVNAIEMREIYTLLPMYSEVTEIPEQDHKRMEEIVRRQALRGGYRLAKILNEIFSK
jgi:hypothetical protein